MRNGQAERLRRLEVDDQLELRRLLDGKVSRLRPLQDLVRVSGGAAEHVRTVYPIHRKTARVRELPQVKYRRQAALDRKIRNPFEIRHEHRVWHDGQSASARPGCLFERLREIGGAPYLERMKLDSELPCWELDFFPTECGAAVLWIPEHSHAGELGNNFPEELQPFSNQLRDDLGQPRDVATGPRQALNKPSSNRVTGRRHNDRDYPGSVFCGHSIARNGSDDEVNLETDQIGCEVRKAIVSPLRIPVLDADVLSLNPSEVTQTLPECLVPEAGLGRRE